MKAQASGTSGLSVFSNSQTLKCISGYKFSDGSGLNPSTCRANGIWSVTPNCIGNDFGISEMVMLISIFWNEMKW